jgi:mitogen-activated protein kinase organizer 1
MSIDYKIPSTVKYTLDAHKGTVYAVKYTSIGDYCISCGEDKLIQVFNPSAGTLVKTFEGHGKAVYDLCISKDSAKFASGGADRSVYLWDVEQGRNTKRFGGHSQVFILLMFFDR